MFVNNGKTAPQKRAAREKKELHTNMADSQELIAALIEQNDLLTAQNEELKSQLIDVQELTASLIEK